MVGTIDFCPGTIICGLINLPYSNGPLNWPSKSATLNWPNGNAAKQRIKDGGSRDTGRATMLAISWSRTTIPFS